jgi:signal peptidase I
VLEDGDVDFNATKYDIKTAEDFFKDTSFMKKIKKIVSEYKESKFEKIDSVKSVLNQLIRSNLFQIEDKIDLIKNSFIVKMDKYASDDPADPDGGLIRAHRKAVQRLRRQKTNET